MERMRYGRRVRYGRTGAMRPRGGDDARGRRMSPGSRHGGAPELQRGEALPPGSVTPPRPDDADAARRRNGTADPEPQRYLVGSAAAAHGPSRPRPLRPCRGPDADGHDGAMSLAVCLLFDPDAERAIRDLWSRLEDHGIPTLLSHTHGHHHAHLSYAVALEWDLARVQEAIEGLGDRGGFSIDVQGMLAFTRGRAALAVSVTADVVRRQEQVVSALTRTGATVHRHYLPGAWMPHISLVTTKATGQLPLIARTVSAVLPLRAQVVAAALIDSSTGESSPLLTIP